MKLPSLAPLIFLVFCTLPPNLSITAQTDASPFSLEAVCSYPFPGGLTASAETDRIAWVFNEEGRRNVYVAEGPDFQARKLTPYDQDDGQEITSLSVSADGNWVVYLRGGEHGSNWDDEETVNPLSTPFPEKVQMFSIPFEGGEPIILGEGAGPVVSPASDRVAFVRKNQVWTIAIDGEGEAEQLFSLRGSNGSPVWSPDGSKLAFVSRRGDHSYVGIYHGPDQRIEWAAPGFDRDGTPRWSPGGQQLVFVRRPGSGGVPDPVLERTPNPWKLMTYDLKTQKGKTLWEAPETLEGSLPRTHGGTNLHWADARIVFSSYHDGWPHLYSIDPEGGELLLLTPGDFMVEYVSLSPDGKTLLFSANTGPDKFDIDRRHVARVSVDKADMEVLTPGAGNEWAPVMAAGDQVALLSATAQRPPLPAIIPVEGGSLQLLAEDHIPDDFPTEALVTPKQVTFQAPDGLTIHGTLFEREDIAGEKPAVVYIHGGPPRQMLLGWHYSSYYSNAYAVNQYLASQGFAVLSVNYRLGIGYGFDFHYPESAGWRGASEYQDIRAAGEWLAAQPQIDADRIGVYGGSYGGYLTALALGKDSDLFAAGVDIHGVHDRSAGRIRDIVAPDRYERAPDAEKVPEVIWASSPTAYVDSWTSPVLIIHGDDDRNVSFRHSVDLVQRLRAKGADLELMAIVDDTHHFMLHANQLAVNAAIGEFLVRRLGE